MTKSLSLAAALVAATFVAGCAQREDPNAVSRNAAADAAKADKNRQARAAAARSPAQAAAASANDGSVWTLEESETGSRALYGAPQGEASFTIACDASTKELIFSRPIAIESDVVDMRLGAGPQVAVVEGKATVSPLPSVSARIPVGDALARALATSSAPLTVQVGPGDALSVPASAEMRRIVADCR